MGRKRQYDSAAERLKAFRARLVSKKQVEPILIQVSSSPKPKRGASRQARLLALENDAQGLLDEFQSWRENLPESLQESRLAAKLDEAIDRFTDIVEISIAIDLPKGYGRD